MKFSRLSLLLIIFFLCSESILIADEVQKRPFFAFLKTTKAPISSVKVINFFPHDQEAFTQGFVCHNGYFYESTGRYGKSTLRKVELKSGKTVKEIKLPHEYFGEGIAILGGKIFQLTWRNKIAFVYDLMNFEPVSKFSYPGEGWGITTDEKYLFMSDGTSVLSCIDPKSFAIIRKINVFDGKQPIGNLNELEFIKGEIWANVFMEDVIVRISPLTGKVLGWVDLSPLYSLMPKNENIDVLNGIAYDKNRDRIFVTGKLWPKIFEIKVLIKD